jgi:DedD protein
MMKRNWSSFMDRRLKERLAGATILVVLIVLIVPELLSGPKRAAFAPRTSSSSPAEPVRNVTMDLATNKALPAAETPGAVSATPSGAVPTPDDAAREASTGAPADDAAHEGAAAAPAPGPASTEPAEAPGHRVSAPPTITTLQAQQPAAAPVEKSTSSPRSTPAAPRSTPGLSSDGAHHNWMLQIGSFATRANAENLVRQLKARGFPALLSPSGSGKALRYRVRVGPMADHIGADKMLARLRKEGHSASVVAP